MTPIISTIEISRPAEEVFEYATDPSRFSEWQKDVVSGRMEDPGPARVGSRFTTTRQIGRSKRTTTQEITEIDPPRSWAVRGIDGPVRASAKVRVEPLEGNERSRLTVELDFEGHGIGKMLVPLVVRPQAEKISPKSYKNLKELLESGDLKAG